MNFVLCCWDGALEQMTEARSRSAHGHYWVTIDWAMYLVY